MKNAGLDTFEYKGYYIDHFPYSWTNANGDIIKSVDAWIILSPNYLVCDNGEKVYMPLYTHYEDNSKADFNSLDEAKDYIDKYMVNNRGKYIMMNRDECHYIIKSTTESLLNEVYPNKGESKKDFTARFMSATKDEYPDVKQRYAVCMSYWDRRNKKRVKENMKIHEGVDKINKNIDAEKVVKKVFNNDFEETQRLARLIGITTPAELDDFINREALMDEEPLDTLKRYIMSTFTESLLHEDFPNAKKVAAEISELGQDATYEQILAILNKYSNTQEPLNEASLNYSEQKAKMQACEYGTRGFNAGAASDEKLRYNRQVCQNEGYKKALKIVEDEMIRRGLLTRQNSATYGATSQPQAQPQQASQPQVNSVQSNAAPAPVSQPSPDEFDNAVVEDDGNFVNKSNAQTAVKILADKAQYNDKYLKAIIRLFNAIVSEADVDAFAERTFDGFKLTIGQDSNSYTDKNAFTSAIIDALFNSDNSANLADSIVNALLGFENFFEEDEKIRIKNNNGKQNQSSIPKTASANTSKVATATALVIMFMNDAINNNALSKFVNFFNIVNQIAPEKIKAMEADDANVLEYLNTGYKETYAIDRSGIIAFVNDMGSELTDPMDQDSTYTENLLTILAHFGYRI